MRTDRAEAPPSDLIQSVSRALRILETVGRSTGGLTVKQIARRCELGLSTAYHLVRTLTYEGYLARCPDGSYLPGLEVAARFREFSAAVGPPADTDAGLRRAANRTGYSHYLGRFVSGKVAITGVAEGPRSPHIEDLVVGFDEAAHATAVGKALLATLDSQRRRQYLSTVGMRPYTRSTIVDRDELECDLAGLRRKGAYVECGQFREGVACAATVIEPRDLTAPRMVLATTMSAADFTRHESVVLTQLNGLARGLAEAVANEPPPPPLTF